MNAGFRAREGAQRPIIARARIQGTLEPWRRWLDMERISQLVETAFMIAWEYLQATGELDEPEASARQLLDTIEVLIQRGERRRLLLANVAIDVYKKNRRQGEVRHGQPGQKGAA